MGDDQELEDIVATGAKAVKVIKPHADNAEVVRKIRHAVRTGCVAVGMDIDHAYNGRGGYDSVFDMPLIKQGPEAVAARIDQMTCELADVMARTGVRDLSQMDPSVIHHRRF